VIFTSLILVNFLGGFAKLQKKTISFVISVCPSLLPSVWNNSAATGRIFLKFDIWGFFKSVVSQV
jgi:hypothetical protein